MTVFLFLLVVDWVMRKTTRDGNTGIIWKFSGFLEDLDFADDLGLISSKREHNLGRYGKMTGLKINTAKTIIIRWNIPTSGKVQVNGRELEEVLKSWGNSDLERRFRRRL